MRILVCGPRDWTDEEYIYDVLDCLVLPRIKLLISGVADGVDAISCEWANSHGIPVYPVVARWRKHKRAAGIIRNSQLLKGGKPDLGLAFRYAGEAITPGTADMVRQLEKAGVKVRVLPRLEID